ncbi:NAD(P)-dependent oxidoreductase [Halorarum halophilum]|uniref:NAD(P)-dependent oxidoreductase n=1 Tax=Halorarum halophilum TaxID=2743090 RepID=A0A7D5K992_9EURY|nr:NAD(P)-dependent oxidoreductase [Halobaculum halophilum]QLG28834.1 NAD(P)-dependent oxidoreductase [Halobaculum halophilum]
MDVLVTGAYGRCGTAIIDHLHDREGYDFTYYNRSDRPPDHPYGGYDTVVGDIADYETLRDAFEGRDAVIHLAAYPLTDGDWGDVLEPNIVGMYNALEAAREAEVESFVFGSSNHVVGMYELEHRPEIYSRGFDLVLDHEVPVRPDSYYGASKSFGEDLGRYYVEEYEYPKRFYALRICTVNDEEYDHPYGDAEQGADEGEWERGSAEYEEAVARMTSTWQSRRDFAHMIDRCLRDDTVEFDVFNGVSDNRSRWFDLEHARATLGYDPQDDSAEWDGPPE